MAAEFGAEPVFDYRSIIGRVDAASVAVPTTLHYDVARPLIEAGINVLVEKPLTETGGAGLAHQARGGAERGAPGRPDRALFQLLSRTLPRSSPIPFISRATASRSGRSAGRGRRHPRLDDLRYRHDHRARRFAGQPRSRPSRQSRRSIDLANARITFESGCVANVTASRVSYKTERRMRVFANEYFSCDLGEGRISGYRLRGDPMTEGFAAIATETHEIKRRQPCQRDRLISRLCPDRKKPLVDGRAGSEALRVASMINESIEEHLKRCARARPAGPGGAGEPPA